MLSALWNAENDDRPRGPRRARAAARRRAGAAGPPRATRRRVTTRRALAPPVLTPVRRCRSGRATRATPAPCPSARSMSRPVNGPDPVDAVAQGVACRKRGGGGAAVEVVLDQRVEGACQLRVAPRRASRRPARSRAASRGDLLEQQLREVVVDVHSAGVGPVPRARSTTVRRSSSASDSRVAWRGPRPGPGREAARARGRASEGARGPRPPRGVPPTWPAPCSARSRPASVAWCCTDREGADRTNGR